MMYRNQNRELDRIVGPVARGNKRIRNALWQPTPDDPGEIQPEDGGDMPMPGDQDYNDEWGARSSRNKLAMLGQMPPAIGQQNGLMMLAQSGGNQSNALAPPVEREEAALLQQQMMALARRPPDRQSARQVEALMRAAQANPYMQTDMMLDSLHSLAQQHGLYVPDLSSR